MGRGRVVGRRGEGVDQECVAGKTRVPFATLGVEDPERRAAPRRPVAVVRHERLRALADDVATQADPRPTGQLQADPGRFGDRGRETPREPGRIQDQEQGLRATGERGQSVESITDLRGPIRFGQSTAGQVQDKHVHRPSRQE